MELIVAEKPMVARAIASALGGYHLEEFVYDGAKVDYYCSDLGYIVALEGHLVQPQKKRSSTYPNFDWQLAFPRKGKRRARWELLKRLVVDADKLIGATDYDEEGEVMLFYTVNGLKQQTGADLPNPEDLARMRFVSLAPDEIRAAHEDALGGRKLNHNMVMAGHVRHLLDLWFGKNISHLFSGSAVRVGAPPQIKYFLGRVKIPIMQLLSSKHTKIMEKPRAVGCEGEEMGATEEKIYDVSVSAKFYGEVNELYSETRLDFDEMRGLLDRINEWKAKVTGVDEQEVEETPRREVYNTDGIQDAATAQGIPITEVDGILQQLYLMGFISYPRTASKKLVVKRGGKMFGATNVAKIIKDLARGFRWIKTPDFLDKIPQELWERKEVEHLGIFPTGKIPSEVIPDKHRIVWELITRKFLSALAKPACYTERTYTITLYDEDGEEVGEDTASFSQIEEWGWRKYAGSGIYVTEFPPSSEGWEVPIFPAVETGEPATGSLPSIWLEFEVPKHAKTSARELLDHMRTRGLGTEATRGTHMVELEDNQYTEGGEELALTVLGQRLAELTKKHVPELKISTTAQLHRDMGLLKLGRKRPEGVLNRAKKLIENTYNNNTDLEALGRALQHWGSCPLCGSGTVQTLYFEKKDYGERGYKRGSYFLGCSNYPECKFKLPIAGRWRS